MGLVYPFQFSVQGTDISVVMTSGSHGLFLFVRLATKPCSSGYQTLFVWLTIKCGSQRPVGKILDFRAFRLVVY